MASHKTSKKRAIGIRYTHCKGELRWKDFRVEIKFSVSCSSKGALKVNINSVPLTESTSWLLWVQEEKSPTLPYLTLSGSDGEGSLLQSEYIYLTSVGTRSTPRKTSITIEAEAAALEVKRIENIDLTKPASGAVVYYHTVGMAGFSGVSAPSSIGEITLQGPTRLDDYDRMSGLLAIEAYADEKQPLDAWLKNCDDIARAVLDIISLAEGAFIRWSLSRLFIENELVALWFRGPRASGPPREPLYSHLNLGPFLNIALNSYTPELKQKTGVDVAIEWFLMDPRYLELQFLAGMTSLEHMVQVFSSRVGSGGLFPSEYFSGVVKPELESAVKKIKSGLGESVPDKEKRREIEQALENLAFGNLNGKSLKVKLFEMLRHYEVPIGDIEMDVKDLIATRNKIAHMGSFRRPEKEKNYIHHQLGILRELLKRIFMKLLGYEGQYHSSLAGLPWLHFPPENKADQSSPAGAPGSRPVA